MSDAEPRITINGVELTDAQAMTTRVAISNFLIELGDVDFRRHLGSVAASYTQRACEVQALMVGDRR